MCVCLCVAKRDITVTTLRAFLSINQGRVHLSSNKASEEGWRETEMEAGGAAVRLWRLLLLRFDTVSVSSAQLTYNIPTHTRAHTHADHKQCADKQQLMESHTFNQTDNDLLPLIISLLQHLRFSPDGCLMVSQILKQCFFFFFFV